MSEHMCLVSRTRPHYVAGKRPGVIAAIEEIAERHGYTFVEFSEPGSGYLSWFAGPNLGEPFDRAASLAIGNDLKAAGISRERSRESEDE